MRQFFPLPASAPEGQGNSGVAALRVTGAIAATFNIEVAITGGTAVMGTYFIAPGSTFTVTIPAGDYAAERSFPLPLSAIGNAIIQDNRTVTLAIVPDPNHYVVSGTSTCGAPANAEITWTLIVNDVDMMTNPVSTPSRVIGPDFTYTVTYANNTARTTVAPLDAHDASVAIADAMPAGISFGDWTCAASGGASFPDSVGVGEIDTGTMLPAGDGSVGGQSTYIITARLDAAPITFNAIINTVTIAIPAGIAGGISSAAGFVTPTPRGTANTRQVSM